MARASFFYLAAVTLGAHGALAAGILAIDERPRPRPPTVVAFVSPKPKPAPKPPVVEAPAPLAASKPTPVRVQKTPSPLPAAAAPIAAAPAAAAPAPDFGVTLGGGGGGGAPSIGNGGGGGGGGSAGPVETSRRVLTAPAKADPCDEPPGKPKALAVPQPAYTEAARAAGISGRVRVEITVDERGHVARVRVLEGLGYGLDEAALASARAATFDPAMRCGKPVSATFTVAMRFNL